MTHRAWTVICDVDGTIAPADVTDELLARFGRPGWEALEADWREGRIGSRTCMAGQVALLGCSRDELDAYLATVEIDPDFPAFVAAVRALGWRLEVVSDGLDHACRSILVRHDLGHLPLAANRLVQDGPRQWRLEFPFAASTCAAGNCKCAHASLHAAVGDAILLVGDGASDFCVASDAHAVFARGSLLRHCAAAGVAAVPVPDFAEAIRALAGLPAGRSQVISEDVA